MLEYKVSATRIDTHGSEATTKEARLVLDTDVAGRVDAFNPAELLLASLATCIIKGIERVTPMLHSHFRGVTVDLHGIRQDAPPMMTEITYEIVVDTDEDDRRLELLHNNVRKYGTISNTLAHATKLEGTIKRANISSTLIRRTTHAYWHQRHGPYRPASFSSRLWRCRTWK